MKTPHGAQSEAALSNDFLDWWFAPWSYLPGGQLPALSDAPLARRDAYRQWCAATGAQADLPQHFDAAWQTAALQEAAQLRHCAALFGGLFAAREHDFNGLSALPKEQQSWCMSVSLAQPLVARAAGLVDEADSVLRGLAELALRLEGSFPGMWSRLRLLLPESVAESVARLLVQERPAVPTESAAALRRAQRCWHICCERVGLGGAAFV